jgi:hypothetical protein
MLRKIHRRERRERREKYIWQKPFKRIMRTAGKKKIPVLIFDSVKSFLHPRPIRRPIICLLYFEYDISALSAASAVKKFFVFAF